LDVPASVLDISRASRELHWQPRVSLQDGVGQMIVLFHELASSNVI